MWNYTYVPPIIKVRMLTLKAFIIRWTNTFEQLIISHLAKNHSRIRYLKLSLFITKQFTLPLAWNQFSYIRNKIKKSLIDKLNINRRDMPADFTHIKNHKRFKLANIYKKVSPALISNSHARVNNKNYYKSRSRQQKRLIV